MKLVFNETLLSSVGQNLSNISDNTNIFNSNIILERKIVTAQIASMDDLFRKLNIKSFWSEPSISDVYPHISTAD